MKKYAAWISWGTEGANAADDILSERDPSSELNVTCYDFKTEAELDAFLLGIEESNGWMNYHCVTDPKLGKKLEDYIDKH